ncbi:MAG: DUF167 domain-containing protein [Bacteroidetes bacterium]|nr:DUF167 domain-containing protein [Bacteroidota bacterium]
MKIAVHVKPNARFNSVDKISENEYIVKVIAQPRGGRANRELIKILSDFLGIPQSTISIRSGQTSKRKIVEILLNTRTAKTL